jgi:aminoglycoside phosphotransferase
VATSLSLRTLHACNISACPFNKKQQKNYCSNKDNQYDN